MTIQGRFRLFAVIISAIVICSTTVSLILFQYRASQTKKKTTAIVLRIIETTVGDNMSFEVRDIASDLRLIDESDRDAVFESRFKDKYETYSDIVHIIYSQSRNVIVYSDVSLGLDVFESYLRRAKNGGGSYVDESNGSIWYVRMNYISGTDYIYLVRIDIGPIARDMMAVFEPMVSFFRFIMIGTVIMSILMLAAINVASYLIVRRVAVLEENLNEKNDELQQINLLLNVEVDIRKTIESDLKKANGELRRLSKTDPLTKISNRRHFDEVLSREWKSHSREQRPLSVVLCDVDMFKKFNDEYGHQKGDKCLIEVASVIRKTCKRPFDFVARYGGEEFVAVLPETDESGAAVIAESLITNMREKNIPHKGSAVDSRVTVSVGIATMIPENGKSPDILIKKADTALYNAKESGRNRWVAADNIGTQ